MFGLKGRPMRGLAETIAELGQRGKTRTRVSRGGEGAELIEVKGFGFNPGALKMLSYVPQRLAPGAALVVVLHGCTQQATAYASDAGWITLAERFGFALLAPSEPASQSELWREVGDGPEQARAAGGLGQSIMASVAPHVPASIQRVISTALTSAGLMR